MIAFFTRLFYALCDMNMRLPGWVHQEWLIDFDDRYIEHNSLVMEIPYNALPDETREEIHNAREFVSGDIRCFVITVGEGYMLVSDDPHEIALVTESEESAARFLELEYNAGVHRPRETHTGWEWV